MEASLSEEAKHSQEREQFLETLSDKDRAATIELEKLAHDHLDEHHPHISKKHFYLEIEGLHRLVLARDHKIPKSFEMWQKWLNWRLEYKVEEITKESLKFQFESRKAFWYGVDKKGHPCLIIRTGRHFPDKERHQEMVQFSIYLIEEGSNLADQLGVGKVCVIYDRNGFTSANKDSSLMSLMKRIVSMMQDYYAERLSDVYVLHTNWFYWLVWNIIKPFLAKKTKEKIHIMSKPEDLLEHFDADMLSTEYGGDNTWEYEYPNCYDYGTLIDKVNGKTDDEDLVKPGSVDVNLVRDSNEETRCEP
eukprot:CAMPEP_0115004304 /NCGR_PEP_ID=MMETSP0216-20121206/19116_1 /TAXON_ID=223996 /ORGANISM="Protocruzia adherens, Strain Boccale" /LENGTH=304 /DNA_ID=CAMNT_0002370253 /DNA_START=52 /DNA_END=966 /DNA_ORIENTATION=-